MDIENKKIAVWEKGEDSTYINCEFEGGDIGFLDEGIRTSVIDSKSMIKSCGSVAVKIKWFETWWGRIIIGLIVAVGSAVILLLLNLKI
jgi:hypothetical protein